MKQAIATAENKRFNKKEIEESMEAIFVGDDFKCDILAALQVGIEEVLISKEKNIIVA